MRNWYLFYTVLMFENKYIILLCFVVYNQFQIWIWIKLHCLLYLPIVYLMFNNLSFFFQFIPIHYWHPDSRLENYVRFAGLIRKIFFFPFPFPLVKIILHDLTML
jgi:hypothetical protein